LWRRFLSDEPAVSLFSKPALTLDQQIDLLRARGMLISDLAQAKQHLSHINYYRLRAYWLPLEHADPGDGRHAFKPNSEFSSVLACYSFDRALRLLLMDAIERIEISLRTRFAQVLSLRYGPFAHEESAHFKQHPLWQKSRDELSKEYARSRETFAEHYRNQYPHLPSPPLWVACELMTLGHLSRWLQNLRVPKDRQTIADAYGLDEKVLVSFAHHLTVVRNHCAHHGRVWNRKFAVKMLIPGKKPHGLSTSFHPAEDRRIYNTLAMLAHLVGVINPTSDWKQRLQTLVQNTPAIDVRDMGFPPAWTRLPVWQG
jgi:abortive infection bacteriophage resistance protein